MIKYFLLYFYLILIISSILGYGFLLANYLNKNLLKYNRIYRNIRFISSCPNIVLYNFFCQTRLCSQFNYTFYWLDFFLLFLLQGKIKQRLYFVNYFNIFSKFGIIHSKKSWWFFLLSSNLCFKFNWEQDSTRIRKFWTWV